MDITKTIPLNVATERRRKRAFRMYGSSLVEFLVMCTCLLPVLFSIPMIGKLAEQKFTGIQASRYISWEQAHTPVPMPGNSNGAEALRNRIRDRFLGHPAQAILTQQATPLLSGANGFLPANTVSGGHTGVGAGEEAGAGSSQALWRFAGFSDFVIPDTERLALSVSAPSLSPLAKGISETTAKTASILDFAPATEWDVLANGMTQSNLRLVVDTGSLLAKAGANCDRSGNPAVNSKNSQAQFCFDLSTTMLIDGWGAGSEKQAARRTRSFVPAAALAPLGQVLSHVGRLPVFKEMKDLQQAFGYVDGEVLPIDRYVEKGQ